MFKVNKNLDGTVHKYKASLVAMVFHQVAGFDLNVTFSPVVKPITTRTLLFQEVGL